MNTELSAFYFDIRKDTLYCDPPSSLARKAALTAIDIICDAILRWFAPVLSFTSEEAWQLYRPDAEPSVHLTLFPDGLESFRDEKLAAKWETIRDVRRVVTGALELERAAKRIGSSLEASPIIYVSDRKVLATLFDVDLAEVCITSNYEVSEGEAPAGAFRLDGVPGVAVWSKRPSASNARGRGKSCPPSAGPRISRRLAARRAGAARMEGAGGGGLTFRLRPGVIAALAVLALDQASKLWLLRVFDIAHRGAVKVTPFFDLVLAWNTGISYGWFQNESATGQAILLAVKAVAVIVLAIWMARSRSLLATLALGLIIGGAIGNAIDRFAYGAVVDFALFHVQIGGKTFNWYVFNLADVAIVAGVAALLYDSFLGVPAAKAP